MKLNQNTVTKDRLLFSTTCWVLEIVLKIDDFFTRRRQEILDVHYLTLAWVFFGLLIQSIRNNSDRLTLLTQSLKDVESKYRDIGAYDMKHSEFEEMCRKAWSEKINNLCYDMARN